ncbi:hypothetical protein Csa_013529 [Cucumis sativus]|uniref:Uncharacterized protein n=1 Tax=Cucumis sativus TaxID=3659 RepID=A0A0A0LSK8_CUCSA|nr:hypothetical protein Csa_013529 [Cucumis sativus]
METIGTGLPVRTRRCRSGQRRGETVVSGWVWTEQRGEKRETAGDADLDDGCERRAWRFWLRRR